jgi:nucleoid DNA-binding protein
MITDKLINEIAIEAGISRADAKHILKIITDTIIESIAHGEKVDLDGFGSFFSKPLSAYAYVQEDKNTTNVNMNVLAFKQSNALSASINQAYK